MALGRDARRGDPPDGNQLPREQRLAGGARRRRLNRLADRARQPPQADRSISNRRSARRAEVPDHHVFAIYDLDGFKRYNDTYGHPAGDSLLRRLGANLAAAFEPDGSAYRLGGDEFCILVPSRGRQPRADRRSGPGPPSPSRARAFGISASAGAVVLAAEATVASEALRLADRRMYAEKSRRSGRVERQSHELLLQRSCASTSPSSTDHHEDVSRLAVAVGRELGFDAEEIDVLRRAAEFHDIGKIAIPEEILRKPGAAERDRVGADAQRTRSSASGFSAPSRR